MISVNQYRISLVNDLYDLAVNCNISIEKLADDICEDCDAFYQQGRADALSIDMDKPMHFTDGQKAWIKNYIIINAKRQRADAIDECISKVDTLEQIAFGVVDTKLVKQMLEQLKE